MRQCRPAHLGSAPLLSHPRPVGEGSGWRSDIRSHARTGAILSAWRPAREPYMALTFDLSAADRPDGGWVSVALPGRALWRREAGVLLSGSSLELVCPDDHEEVIEAGFQCEAEPRLESRPRRRLAGEHPAQ